MLNWISRLAVCVCMMWIAADAFAATPAAPGNSNAAALYHNYCSVCHGDKGDGKSRAAGSLSTMPSDFTAPESRRTMNRETIAAVITHGKPGTSMVAWRTQLSDKDIARLAEYVHERFVLGKPTGDSAAAISGTRAHGGREADAASTPVQVDMTAGLPDGLKGDFKRGGVFYLANCATCHGARGDGAGPRAYFINPKPLNFLDTVPRARLNRVALYAAISEGKLATEMPAWNKVATRQQIADVAEYVFQSFVLGKAAAQAGAPR